MATIRDVAAACGFSTATISNVLNDTGRPVHPRTRERVLETVRSMRYYPSAMARGMVGMKLHTVGVLFGVLEPEVITNPYASAILQGILTTAAAREYNVTLWTSPWRGARNSAAAFRDGRADGFIVVAPATDSDIIPGLHELGLPLVAVSSQYVPDEVLFVDVDNYKASRLATQHMIALGHTRIAHIGGNETQPSVADRRKGYLDVMQENNLPTPKEYVLSSWYVQEPSKEQSRQLLCLPNRPTAIVTGSDNIASGLLEVAREMNLSVPSDISVTGFDDIPIARMVTPQLTTIRQPLLELGKRAAALLMDKIEDVGPVRGWLAEPELVIRGSTGPPPGVPAVRR